MKRRVRIAVVCVLLAAAGLFVAHVLQDSSAQTDGSQSDTSPTPEAAAASNNPLYKAACNGTLVKDNPGKLNEKDLQETSGIAASRRNPGVYWVHNDSGDSARFFGVKSSGSLDGTYNLSGAEAEDWEDIAVGPGPEKGTNYVYLADTGDNSLNRDHVTIYRVPEPAAGSGEQTLSAFETFNFTFPDGNGHNVEALAIDGQSGKLYLIDKSSSDPAQVFEAPATLKSGSTAELTKVGSLSYKLGNGYEKVTAADISPDGSTVAVRTYEHLYVYDRLSGSSVTTALRSTPCRTPLVKETQGEAAAFTAAGNGLITVGEGTDQPLHELLITSP